MLTCVARQSQHADCRLGTGAGRRVGAGSGAADAIASDITMITRRLPGLSRGRKARIGAASAARNSAKRLPRDGRPFLSARFGSPSRKRPPRFRPSRVGNGAPTVCVG
jgi:hypothetical protein